ncbi:hypothetical protein GH5_01770 [Leishmania sp. Ghana 2012 LV757]|uniref:hypothetical protein n=1 Tax=Leishmania sp. Ghana 2012 LV757 TaxID=2803181 RepID=UPI001B4AA66C|nr:hypothetical protein GH5_01770 [Leishmania sp. Ghana 2012 LV757]
MRQAKMQCLALLASLVWLAAGVQAVLYLNLNSADYPAYAGKKVSMKEYAALPGGKAACVLLSLDNGLGGVVRFTYSSNVSSLHWRSDVVVSIHKPSASQPSVAILESIDAVTETNVYSAEELERRRSAAQVVRRGYERQGTANAGTEAVQQPQSTTVSVRPALNGIGPAAKFIDGNYAACFHLIRSKAAAQKMLPLQYEQVTIQLLEVVSTRRSTLTYIAGLNGAESSQNGDAAAGGTLAEVDREYAMIRSLLRASGTADLRALLEQEEVVTSEEVKRQLEDFKSLQKQLFGVYDGFEHLEDRFLRMRVTAERTFSRIWACTMLTLLAMGGTMWLTFRHTKGVIIKKKLL